MGITLSINDIRSVTAEMGRFADMDFSGYSFSFLKRRLGYVFAKLKVRKLSQFIERLNEENFREDIKYLMAVEVTEMFRDPGFWRSLRQNVFPVMGSGKWKIWFPDASSGEELFSMAILLADEGLTGNVELFSQHPSKRKCDEIKSGIFDHKKMELNASNYRRLEVDDNFESYFHENEGRTVLKPSLLERSHCEASRMEKLSTETAFEMIMFRNSTINFGFTLREETLKMIIDRLAPGGFLALGVKETIPSSLADSLTLVDEKESIYKKPGILNH